jgi:hypothetical protein
MNLRPATDFPDEYRACERDAVTRLVEHCLGDIPGSPIVSLERLTADVPADTIHCTVSVDGQIIGSTVGTWIRKEPDKPYACVFTLFPKYRR